MENDEILPPVSDEEAKENRLGEAVLNCAVESTESVLFSKVERDFRTLCLEEDQCGNSTETLNTHKTSDGDCTQPQCLSLSVQLQADESSNALNNLKDLNLVDIEDVEDHSDELNDSLSESDAFNINDLPIELLGNIMSYLSQTDLCLKVAPVCRLWRDLAYDPTHWQKLEFCRSDMPNGTLVRCLTRATRLKHLTWNHTLTLEEVLYLGNYCQYLRELNLGFCDNLNAVMISRIVEGCALVHTLNLEGCRLIDEECINLICTLTKLSDLNLSHCMRIQDNSVMKLAQRIPALMRLNIEGINHITDRAIVELVEHQKDFVLALELDGAELTDDSMEKISTCPNLIKLSVSFAELLTGKSLRFIRSMSSLRCLKVKKGMEICSGALHHMFEMGKLSHLSSLDLSECTNVDDEVVKALVKCCGSSLRSLSLCWCWSITDAGLQEIIVGCKRMRVLDMLGVDKMQGDVLIEVPYRMPDLIYLNLQQCNLIQDDIVECMVRQKPDLVALNYYGEEFSVACGEFV